jgi:hypothetical protein
VGKDPRRLALLIAVPDERAAYAEAAWNDQAAMHQALRARGVAPGQILTLGGSVGRAQVLDFLRDAGRRVAKWQDGLVILHYTGSGYWPEGNVAVDKTKTGLDHLGPAHDEHILWDEVFAALDLPAGVRLLLLPDC